MEREILTSCHQRQWMCLSKNDSQTRGSGKDGQGSVQGSRIIQSTHKRPLHIFLSSGLYARTTVGRRDADV